MLHTRAECLLGRPVSGVSKRKPGAVGDVPSELGPRMYIAMNAKRHDMISLPWRMGLDCQLGKETAEGLHVFSLNLRACMRKAVPANDVRPDADKLKALLTPAKFRERTDVPFK